MAIYRLLGAAAALALISAPAMTPAMAQQVISEPGYCAFFYPNANCQNKGPGNPYTGDYQRRRQQPGLYGAGQQSDGRRREKASAQIHGTHAVTAVPVFQGATSERNVARPIFRNRSVGSVSIAGLARCDAVGPF